MSDLDDLEEFARLPDGSGRKRHRYRSHGEMDTHCRRGHGLTPENTYVTVQNGYTLRQCKKCQRLRILCREDS